MKRLLLLLLLFAPAAMAQNTFCASNLPCTVTGAWQFSNLSTMGSGSTVNGTSNGGSTINGTFWVCPVPCVYTTLAQAVSAANTAGGGIIFDLVTETFTADPFASIPINSPVAMTVNMGAGQWFTNTQIIVPFWVKIIGVGEWNGTGGTVIRANVGNYPAQVITAVSESGSTATFSVANTSGFTTSEMAVASGVGVAGYNQACAITAVVLNTSVSCAMAATGLGASSGGTLSLPIIRLGKNTQAHTVYVKDLTLDCQNIVGCAGIASNDLNEYSGARDMSIINFSSVAIDVESNGSFVPQNALFENLEITPGNSSTTTTQGIRYVGNGGFCPSQIRNVNVVANIPQPMGIALFMANCQTTIIDHFHSEQAAVSIQLGDATLGGVGVATLRQVSAVPNPAGGTNVSIPSGVTSSNYSIWGAFTNTGNNVLDVPRGNTITDLVVDAYFVGQGATPEVYSTSGQVNKVILGGTTLLGNTVENGEIEFKEGALVIGRTSYADLQADSVDHFLHASYNNAGNQQISQIAMATSVFTNATTTPSNVTGLSFTVAASRNYTMDCQIYYQGSAATAGLDIAVTGPAASTSIFYSYEEDSTGTGVQESVASAFGTKLVGNATVTATTNLPAHITMGLRNGVNAGTVQVQGSATGAGTVTIQPGSYCSIQ